jgi:hypothetical protein
MDSSMLPSAVKEKDLKQEVDEWVGYEMVAESIVSFI